jgi:predicted NUDIX family NTP pyrophosphohydrolase
MKKKGESAVRSLRGGGRRRCGKGQVSAGILPYRRLRDGGIEVFLVHPGGPFFQKRDVGVWTIPKGGVEKGEDYWQAAQREFQEETGFPPPNCEEIPCHFLGEVQYPTTGKRVVAWAAEMPTLNPTELRSNAVQKVVGGREVWWPEVDRAGWFSLLEAHRKVFAPLRKFLEEVERYTEEEGL